MNILVVTDTPIERAFHAPIDKIGISHVSTLSTDVDVIFAEDLYKGNSEYRLRGLRYDLVLLPITIQDVDDVHQPVYEASKLLTHGVSGLIQYYGRDYRPGLEKLGVRHSE